ncbi:hypothetical protein HQQ80_17705 [Microbacteriaceae bacterium VKM Ac-2855]|nr:hypothetical protein [Microbacteriaceae bacterium VKM Ac-2855]
MADDIALLQTTSSEVGPDGVASVVLRWESVGEVVGYQLRRRPIGAPASEAVPVGGVVRLPRSADELRAAVAPGSPGWDELTRTLTAATPGAPGTVPVTVDPAAAFERGLTGAEERFIRAGAQASLTLGRVAGLAFVDADLPGGAELLYELHGVRSDDSSLVLASDVSVIVGAVDLAAPPQGLRVQIGDRRVLLLWNRNPKGAVTYLVQRAATSAGPFAQVNPLPVAYDMTEGIDGTPLPFEQPGFLDVGAWDADGLPVAHPVAGAPVAGPDTGTTYWYRVAARDTLDRVGAWSTPVAAAPVRSLAPMAPDELVVRPTPAATGLVLEWRTVLRNVENHRLVDRTLPDPTQTSLVYRAVARADLEDIDGLAAHLVAMPTVIGASNPAVAVQTWTDTDPVLVPPYGTQPFFYRLRVVDAFGILSAPSAIVAATVPDTTPPGPTDIIAATGAADRIRVEWKGNPEPDVGGYQIYRGLCDRGYVYVPGVVRVPGQEGPDRSRYRCDMTLVGDVPVGEAASRLFLQGVIYFEDTSVPANSPLCYAYWVRAYDHSGNLYAGEDAACPKPGEYVCAALHEKTPPRAPVVTAMRARNRAVELEWIGAPEPDLHAFHVYRSDTEADSGRFVACVFTDGSVQATPWAGVVPSCSAVPVVADPLAAHGVFTDHDVEPHLVQWYRVSALDWLGNESDAAAIENIPSSSTFTYRSDRPATPTVHAATIDQGTCGLAVEWDALANAADLRGFVVFRAAVGKPYRQVSGVVTGLGFVDESARRGVDYTYRVQSVDLAGTLSEPSAPVLNRY